MDQYINKVEILQVNGESGAFNLKGSFDHPHPPTKVRSPLFATIFLMSFFVLASILSVEFDIGSGLLGHFRRQPSYLERRWSEPRSGKRFE